MIKTKRDWTAAELDDMRANYGKESAASIGARIGRTLPAIHQKAMALGLRAVASQYTTWTPEMEQTLREMYPTATARQIGAVLGLSLFNIKDKIKTLKLSKPRAPATSSPSLTSWTPEQDDQLRALYPRSNASRIAKIMNRSTSAIYTRAFDLKLTDPKKHCIPIGGERVNSHGLLVRKIANTGNQHQDYKRVDILEWEAVNGPVPEGYTLMIINKYLPRTISNLRMVTKEELWATLTGAYLPPEARELLALQRQIERASKKQKPA